MALETLSGLSEINGESIVFGEMPERVDGSHIYVEPSTNIISFHIQNGPIKEAGKNGCQVTVLIAVAKHIIEKLNSHFPCRENAVTITKLDEALMWQKKRTDDRTSRGVEGFNKP